MKQQPRLLVKMGHLTAKSISQYPYPHLLLMASPGGDFDPDRHFCLQSNMRTSSYPPEVWGCPHTHNKGDFKPILQVLRFKTLPKWKETLFPSNSMTPYNVQQEIYPSTSQINSPPPNWPSLGGVGVEKRTQSGQLSSLLPKSWDL